MTICCLKSNGSMSTVAISYQLICWADANATAPVVNNVILIYFQFFRNTVSNLEKPINNKVKTRWVNQKESVEPKINEETTNEVPLKDETAELLEAFESASLGRRKRQSRNACDKSLQKPSDDVILVKEPKERLVFVFNLLNFATVIKSLPSFTFLQS